MEIKTAERIKELRDKKGIKQIELAQHLSVSRTSVNAWEMGLSVPSLDRLIIIAQYFHVSLDYLVGMTDSQEIDVSHLDSEELELIHRLLNYFDSKH